MVDVSVWKISLGAGGSVHVVHVGESDVNQPNIDFVVFRFGPGLMTELTRRPFLHRKWNG